MRSIKFVHIGDVHYPEATTKGPVVDQKDTGFSSEFVDKFSPDPFIEVGDCLVHCLENGDIDGILFSGDLTSVGNVEAYEECVRYFDELIKNAESASGGTFSVHAVPGNHDLKRYGLVTDELAERFKEFEAAWSSLGRDILPVEAVKKTDVCKGELSARVFSLNTCIGCGEEYKKFPSEIADVYKKLLEEADLDDVEQFDNFCDRIDTPAIHQDHLREIERDIADADDATLSIVLGHHALLPQPTVRVALYTEILNGGNARMALTTLQNPIIYCHGHIHDDPIEIISLPESDDEGLVLVSAPEYSSGFNVIEIKYTNSGYPVGVVITPYRSETWGKVREKPEIRIPIRKPASMVNFCDENTEQVYLSLKEKTMRFGEIQSQLGSQGVALSAGELENALNELEWLQVINISNKTKASRGWLVGRVGI